MRDLFESLRYEYPKVFFFLILALTINIFVAAFMLLPNTSLFRAMGINEGQQRVSAAGSWIYWSTRAMLHREGHSVYQTVYGSIEGIDNKGRLVLSVPEGTNYAIKSYNIANTEISDVYSALQVIGAFKQETAKMEIYDDREAVIWIRNTPLNIRLIEQGVAKPASNPPSNIFDRAFATYYLRIFKGLKQD